MYKLRPYQEEAKQAVLSAWKDGQKKTLLVLPTGCGKTIVFASVAENQVKKGDRVLILAHRGELLEQAAAKIKQAAGLDSALEKAESSALGSNLPITVGSIQSMTQEKRLAAFPKDYYQDIIVDEAHHCLSDSYQHVLSHFPDANILGVTATPDRGDMKDLSEFFDSKAYEYSIVDAIKENYLCPIKAQMIPLKVDIGKVSISNGDFAAGEIGNALDPYLEKIAQEMTEYCHGRKTVVFLPLIHTSQKFCKLLNDNGLNAAEVNGKSKERSQILSDFENGKYEVLCNSMLLTEGWDCPSVDCIVVLRPTKIRSLYQQMVGRGMRLSPGKDSLLLLDFLWMTEKHSLCRPSALVSQNEEIAQRIDAQVAGNGGSIDLLDAQAQAEKDILKERESSLAAKLRREKYRKRKLVDPIEYAFSISAEDIAGYEPIFESDLRKPTKKQLAMLTRNGFDTGKVTNIGLASMLIGRIIQRSRAGLATPKQIRCLESFGFEHVGLWSFEEASHMISRIADNKWDIPHDVNPENYVRKNA